MKKKINQINIRFTDEQFNALKQIAIEQSVKLNEIVSIMDIVKGIILKFITEKN